MSDSGAVRSAAEYNPARRGLYDLTLATAQWPDDDVVHVRHPHLRGLAGCGAHTMRYRDHGIEHAPTADDGSAVTCRPCNHWLLRQIIDFADICNLLQFETFEEIRRDGRRAGI